MDWDARDGWRSSMPMGVPEGMREDEELSVSDRLRQLLRGVQSLQQTPAARQGQFFA